MADEVRHCMDHDRIHQAYRWYVREKRSSELEGSPRRSSAHDRETGSDGELTTYATPLTAADLGRNRLSGSFSNRRGGAVVSLLMWKMEGRAVERFFDDEASRRAA